MNKIDFATIDAIPSISDAILLSLSDVQDPEIIDAMALKFDLQEPLDGFCHVFQKNVYLAYAILKHYADVIKADKVYDSFDNEPEPHTYGFQSQALLERHYGALQYDNSLACMSDVLLNTCIRSEMMNSFLVIDKICQDKSVFDVQDSHIVQFLAESHYELRGNGGIIYEALLKTLIKAGISFESDAQGYLVQTSLRNENIMFDEIIKNGSSTQGFLNRVNNDALWLSESESEQQDDYDYNDDRTYNIYKKFDYCDFVETPQQRLEIISRLERIVLSDNIQEKTKKSGIMKV